MQSFSTLEEFLENNDKYYSSEEFYNEDERELIDIGIELNRNGKNINFGKLNKNILRGIMEIDIKYFYDIMEKCKCNGIIEIEGKNGKDLELKCSFRQTNEGKSNIDSYDTLKKYIGDYGMLGHESFGINGKTLSGWKSYKYSSRKWTNSFSGETSGARIGKN